MNHDGDNIFPVRSALTLHDEFTGSAASIHVQINRTWQ